MQSAAGVYRNVQTSAARTGRTRPGGRQRGPHGVGVDLFGPLNRVIRPGTGLRLER
jgi:hypothetical protein